MAHAHLGRERLHAAWPGRGHTHGLWTAAAAAVAAYVFLVTLGAFGPGDAVAVTVVVAVLAVLCVGHAIVLDRTRRRPPRTERAREWHGA